MCTGIRITATGGEVFWGRTMDLAAGMFGEDSYQEMPSSIASYPKNVTVKGTIDEWQTKYAAIGMGITDTAVMYDGVNEVGLAGDAQVLMECTHDSKENIEKNGQTPVTGEEFVTYILTQFGSVKEIRDHYQDYALSDDPCDMGFAKLQFPLHYSFLDETGDGIVLEPVDNGKFKMYDFMGTMTNSPEYGWHTVNINNYIGLNTANTTKEKTLNSNFTLKPIEGGTGYGLFGLPGDYSSPSRFVRAAMISNHMDAVEAKDGINALYTAFHTVMIPRGLSHDDIEKPITDYTRYWSGYDLSNRKVYVQTGNGIAFTAKTLDPSLKEITFTPVDAGSDVKEV